MPILNYTTTIAVQKTVGEIQEILGRAGARAVMVEYDDQRIPASISFQLELSGQIVSFRLPTRWRGVYQALMQSTAERRYKNEEQARRVAWRIVKDWCEAQVAIIEAGAAEISEVFLPYLVNPKSGQTLFEDLRGGYLMLGAGNQGLAEFENQKARTA